MDAQASNPPGNNVPPGVDPNGQKAFSSFIQFGANGKQQYRVDVVLKFNGKPVIASHDLPRMVGNLKPGTRSTLTVFRRGASRDLSVTIGEFESEKSPPRKAREDKPRTGAAAALGLTVADLNEAQKKELKLKGGVRVEAATEAAGRAGLREGDVIVALANVEVNTVRDFEAVLAKLDKSKPIQVLLRRGEWAQYAVIRPQR